MHTGLLILLILVSINICQPTADIIRDSSSSNSDEYDINSRRNLQEKDIGIIILYYQHVSYNLNNLIGRLNSIRSWNAQLVQG